MASEPPKPADADVAKKTREQLDDEIRARTGYSFTVTPTLRKFGGPPPDDSPRPRFSEIFIGKLPRDYFEDELIPVLERYGKIWEMRILLNDKGEGRGFAFATFYEPSVAHNILKSLNGKDIPGRPGNRFSISMSKTHSLVVIKNLPRGKTREALQKDFEEYFEGILHVNIWGVDTEVKPPRLIASLEFGSERAAVSVLHRINTGEVKPYRQSQLEAYYAVVEDDGNHHISILHVRNLPAGCTEQSLAEYFAVNPGFEKARIIKSFGFIHFRDHESAERGLQENYGKVFGGNQLELAWAKTKTFSPQLPREQRFSLDSLPPNARPRSPDRFRGGPPQYPPYASGRYDPPPPPYGHSYGRGPLLGDPYGPPPPGRPYEQRRPDDRYDGRIPQDPYRQSEYGHDPAFSEPPFKRRPDPGFEGPVLGRTVYFGEPERPQPGNAGYAPPPSQPQGYPVMHSGPGVNEYGNPDPYREAPPNQPPLGSLRSQLHYQNSIGQGQPEPVQSQPSAPQVYGNGASSHAPGSHSAPSYVQPGYSMAPQPNVNPEMNTASQHQSYQSPPTAPANGVSGFTSYAAPVSTQSGYPSSQSGAAGLYAPPRATVIQNQPTQAPQKTATQFGQNLQRQGPAGYGYGTPQNSVAGANKPAFDPAEDNGWEG